RRDDDGKARAEKAAKEDAQRKEQLAIEAQKKEETARIKEEQAKKEAQAAKEKADIALYFSRIHLARREWLANNVNLAKQALDACPAELRGWEWYYLKRLCHADRPAPMERMTFTGRDLIVCNRRGQVATIGFGKIDVWTELAINQRTLWWRKQFAFVDRMPDLGEVEVVALALSPDGRYVAAANRPL